MSRKFLTPIDLSANELQNAVIQVLGSAPGSPTPGRIYYNSTTGRLEFRGASTWIDPTDRANHLGTQLAATISNFDTQVRTSRLDQMAVPTAALNVNNQRITALATPTVDTDAATKGYVDSAVNGTDWKASVRAATTANITLSGLQTIDGISLIANDRVLVKDQSTASGNGLYTAQSGAWVRTVDADNVSEINAGMAVMVEEGTLNADSQWRLTTNNPIVLGTTALSFAQIGAGTSYVGGVGITVAGNTISLDTAVAVRKFNQTVGDGVATSITVTHGLASLDVMVQLYEVATGDTVEADVRRLSASQVQVSFVLPPTSNSIRVVVQG